jgi:hypothetical protein
MVVDDEEGLRSILSIQVEAPMQEVEPKEEIYE